MEDINTKEFELFSRKSKKVTIFATIFIFILLFLIFCFRTIEAGQVGVITRFGNVNREVQPGIVLILPWPVEKLTKINAQTQKEDLSASAASADLQDANANLAVNYSVERNQATALYKNIGADFKDKVIVPTVQSAFKGQTTHYTAAELLTKRDEVEKNALGIVQERLKNSGIKVTAISIVNFGFSPEFTKAIEAKQVAQQDAERSKFIAAKAEQEAQADINRAKGQAESQRLLAGSVTPETIRLKELDTQNKALDQWDGKLPTYWGGQGNELFNIPLNR